MKTIVKLSILVSVCLLSSGVSQAQKIDSLVVMPWNTQLSYDRTTGSFLSVSGRTLEGKMQGELLNRFTGMVPGLEITEKAGFGLPNFQYRSLNSDSFGVLMRGRKNVMCIVNDICIPLGQLQLDPVQIESVTFLMDVADRAKYGALASDGALLIKTKGGEYGAPMTIDVSAESGIAFADRVPEWVNGVDYARLNNIAREATDGAYIPQYSVLAINNFAKNDPYSLTYPNVDYKDLMYKNMAPQSSAGINLYGGSRVARYDFSLSGLYSGDLMKGGPVTDNSRFNITAGMGVKVHRYMELSVDFSSALYFRRSGRAAWNDYRRVPAIAYPLMMTLPDDGSGSLSVYGVSKTFTDNYYALMNEGGFRTNRMRSSLLDVALDVELPFITKGLKSRTWLGSSNFFQTTIGKNPDYLAYYWSQSNGIEEISGHKGVKKSEKSVLDNYTFQTLAMYQRLMYDRTFGKQMVSAGATFSLNSTSTKSDNYYQRQMYSILDASYSYDGRYIVEFVGQYVGSSRFARDNRFMFFPTAGLAWTASKEDFLKHCSWLDNLKLRVQAGENGQFDVFGTPYQYRSKYSYNGDEWYGPISTQTSYFGTNRWVSYKTTIDRIGNPGLSWPKVFQIDAGIDFACLNMFALNVSGYHKKVYDSIVDVSSTIPGVYGINGIPLMYNYTGSTLEGIDMTISYYQAKGSFRWGASLSASLFKSVNDVVTNDTYLYDYQKKAGTPTDSYWGYKCIGRYETDDQIASVPALTQGIKAGDLMYEDVNKDNILDENDKVVLGNTEPRMIYALTLDFGWKNLQFNIVGTGRAFYKIAMTNEYFWNGWGDGNYSAFVRDNIGGAYPRLDYVRSEQNFTGSDFWLKDGGWFKLQHLEVSYKIPVREPRWVKSVKFSVKGQNLFTISGIKDVDPESIDAGVTSYPLMRAVTGSMKISF